jgi:hypothetical protein
MAHVRWAKLGLLVGVEARRLRGGYSGGVLALQLSSAWRRVEWWSTAPLPRSATLDDGSSCGASSGCRLSDGGLLCWAERRFLHV